MCEEHGAHGRRRAFVSINDSAFWRNDVYAAERALVVGQMGIEKRRQRREDRGIGIAQRRILEAENLFVVP